MNALLFISLVLVADAVLWLPVYLWNRRNWDVPMSMITANVSAISFNVAVLIVIVVVKALNE